MPYKPHTRITLSGVFGSAATPVEEWSWSFSTAAMASGEPAASIALATTVRSAYVTHLAPEFPAAVVLTRVRAASIMENGRVDVTPEGAYRQGDNLTVQAGTGVGGATPPLTTALVVSLMTARAGATGRGRFFLPFPIYTLGSNYRLTTTQTQLMATKVGAFLSQVATSDQFVGGVEVQSSKGYASPVTAVRVGDVPDTMRSRRGRLRENYSSAAVTT